MVHVGDVISLPLRDKQVDPEGVIAKVGAGKTWRVSGAWSEVRVEVPAECPSDELIAYKALQKARSARDAAPLIAMLSPRPTSPR